jgi:TolB-like protein/Flp pilus assembly protein TadD
VSLEEGGGVTAKIIDLGLAKGVGEAAPESAISAPGGFAGTPEFASPEQFAGIGVDIRSDLYSLGVVLWEMLAGQLPFRGTPAELIYQHQHGVLPLERLKGVPQQVSALLEMLLDKNPKRRFQTPAELLKMLSTVTSELEQPVNRKHEVQRPLVRKVSSRGTRSARTKPQERSVAVLPFESLSANKKDTYFADGVQDEILSNLAGVSQLRVISRTSVMTFRPGDNRNLRSIAQVLGVANVVEGTVRRDGNHVRITIRLVDARADKTLWSETYDRNLSDIFAVQSEIAQMVASKLAGTISPLEKQRIEAKPTHNLEAYDLYMRAKQLIAYSDVNAVFGYYENQLINAIALLQQAVRLDPMFTLAYCLCAQANATLCFRYEWTSARRASADEALKQALRLQPELPEVHLAYAYHLYGVDRDYEKAKGELAIARRGLPNDVRIILAAAWIDRRQGRWDEAIRGFCAAISLDPRNVAPLMYLGSTLANLRRFADAEDAYNRAIEVEPYNLMLKAQKALWVTRKTGNIAPLSSVISALPRLTAEDPGILAWRLVCALVSRDWPQATELITRMKGSDVLNFSYMTGPVPVESYYILLSRIQGEQPSENPGFTEIRQKLSQKAKASPESAGLLSNLAVVDALLGQKQMAIDEAKSSVEMLTISHDIAGSPAALKNLAVVYTWTDETDLAFETLSSVAKVPAGIYYGDLKIDPYWDPLRKDQRFGEILAELSPGD